MKDPKVIFVGLHNKPDKVPLCSSTKSGKLIDKIREQLEIRNITVLKTNLWDVDYFPSREQIKEFSFDWIERVELYQKDIIVLLGQMVHDNFPELPVKILKVAHPASKRSHEEMDDYVIDVFDKIYKALEL